MNRIDGIINDVIDRWEGGFSNHPADRGGPTNLGITQKVLGEYLGRPASVEEVRLLSRATAIAIYRSRYWNTAKIDLLPEALQPVVFDIAVNMGPGTAVKLLQQALGDLGRPMPVDGVIGKQTAGVVARAVADLGAAAVVNALSDRRQQKYDQIVAKDPTQSAFALGWKRRTDGYRLPG